ncbi:MAG: Uma2 family endonuclease [Bacteroidota bacterium]
MHTYYPYLPKNKMELVDGQLYIGSSLSVSRMVLYHILKGYGPGYVMPLLDSKVLQEACIEAFGRGNIWEGPTFEEVAPSTPIHRMASEVMMSIHQLQKFGVFGRDMVVKLGEDAFTPDVYVYAHPRDARQTEYYFDGPPELVIEITHPACREFDWDVRLPKYQQARTPEIWQVDVEQASLSVHRLVAGEYQSQVWGKEPLVSQVLPGLTLWPEKLWEVKAAPMKNHWEVLTDTQPEIRAPLPAPAPSPPKKYGWGSLGFAPEIDLTPSPISFEQFISWTPEAKFEWWEDRPQIGGGEHTTLQVAGLLMMSLGLIKTLRLLPLESWEPHL